MQQISINNRSDLKLSALLSVPADPHCLVIACHGFRGAKENGGRIYSLGEKLKQIGMGLLAFDFQGSGQSEGQYSDLTLTRQAGDLQDVINYADQQFQLPIIVLGRSFGGSTILAGASQDDRIVGYIFWSTTVFLKETFTGLNPALASQVEKGNTIMLTDEGGNYELDPDLFQDFANHNMDDYLRAIGNRPVLIVHGLADEMVPTKNAQHIAQLLPQAQLNLLEGADHRFTQHTAQREDLSIQWLAGHWGDTGQL